MKESRHEGGMTRDDRTRRMARRFVLSLAVIFLLLTFSSAGALEVPPLKARVNDYANMMSPGVRAQLEKDLAAFERSDSTQIVILTINSLEGESLEEFTMKVAEAWKIGQKGKDNGAILLVAKNDRKTRIEVGRGLEGKLTDLTSGRIVQGVINPQFKRGDFEAGFTSGIKAMIDATRGEFKAEGPKRRSAKKTSGFVSALPLLIIGAIVLFFLGRKSKILGGGAGLVGFSAIGYFFGFALVATIIIGVLGLILGVVLPLLFRGRGTGGPDDGMPGGYWSGGGFESSGGGDSFGGGGGDFGGGGASDDW